MVDDNTDQIDSNQPAQDDTHSSQTDTEENYTPVIHPEPQVSQSSSATQFPVKQIEIVDVDHLEHDKVTPAEYMSIVDYLAPAQQEMVAFEKWIRDHREYLQQLYKKKKKEQGP